MEFGNRGKVKNISKVIPFVKSGTGCKLSTRIDETDGFREKKGNGENEYENEITIDQSAHVFEIRLSGTGIGGQTQVIGIDILPSEVTESIKK
jgi:hypothetical protein